jgi:hypothetical protein
LPIGFQCFGWRMTVFPLASYDGPSPQVFGILTSTSKNIILSPKTLSNIVGKTAHLQAERTRSSCPDLSYDLGQKWQGILRKQQLLAGKE